jgi:diguanylate cyclase (GGDEF)-like protein
MVDLDSIRDIARQLPRERLQTARREELERTLAGRDGGALVDVVRAAVSELLIAGELVRVAMEGVSRNGAVLTLVQGTSRLIDLSALPPAREAVPGADGSDGAGDAADAAVRGGAGAAASVEVGSVLEAMERAQDLAVGDPQADDPWVMVSRILALLQAYLPDVSLHAQLSVVVNEGSAAPRLLPQLDLDAMPFWLRHRRTGQSLWIPAVSELPRALQQRLDLEPRDELVTAVVPILSPTVEEGEIGLLYATGTPAWTADALLSLAHRLSAFVSRRWRCQRDVNRRVLTDSLTGIPNRAFFDTQFPLELERVRRGEQPLTLVIGDLDHFKQVNDTYGHQCGDLVLRSVARELLSVLRRIDVVCRIGGEEFAFMLPSTTSQEAREVLARLAGRPFRISLPPELGVGVLTLTMSYGAVTFPESGTSAGELHRKADNLLYQAKERGRNRCCLWTPSGVVVLPSGDGG